MERLQALRQQIAAVMAQLTTWQKVSLVAVVALTLGGLAWMMVSASQPVYRTLYSDIPEQQAARIVEELDKKRIPYRLDNATTISVPQEQLYSARLHVAGLGLTQPGGAGYELFDKADFGMTTFTQKVNYQRALENELARTIKSIQSVREARVHLVMPEEALFRAEQKKASASVILTLHPGRAPDPSQIMSIQHLVSSAVESLGAEQVTIVDSDGRLLARPQGDNPEGMPGGGDGFGQNRKMETDLEERLGQMLIPVVGREHHKVTVRVELDTAHRVETAEEYDPERIAIRSEQRSEESSARTDPVAGGNAGAAANVPDRPEAQAGGQNANNQSNRTNETLNYEVNKIVRQTIQRGFEVKRLSVAVLLDSSTMEAAPAPAADPANPAPANPAPDPAVAMAQRKENIERMIKGAIGFNADRGDIVEVTWENFRPVQDPSTTAEAWYENPDVIAPIGQFLLYALIAALLLLFVIRPIIKGLSSIPVRPAEDVQVVGRTVAELEASYNGSLPVEEAPELGTEAASPYSMLRSEVIQMGGSDIDRTGQIIRQWIRAEA